MRITLPTTVITSASRPIACPPTTPSHAEVEQGAADAQQPVLVEPGGAGGSVHLPHEGEPPRLGSKRSPGLSWSGPSIGGTLGSPCAWQRALRPGRQVGEGFPAEEKIIRCRCRIIATKTSTHAANANQSAMLPTHSTTGRWSARPR